MTASEHLVRAAWPEIDASFDSQTIDAQFAHFQNSLGAIREIRHKQQLDKKPIKFSIRCEDSIGDSLKPMASYFQRMAKAELVEIGSKIEPPAVNATLLRDDLELFVDLDGLIDTEAELKRLEKDKANKEKLIAGKKGKLSSEKFVNGAPPEIVQRERDGLTKLEEELSVIIDSISALAAMK